MLYEVYSIDNSLYAKMANDHKLIIISRDYKEIAIIYLSENKDTLFYRDINEAFLYKHISKIAKRLQEEIG